MVARGKPIPGLLVGEATDAGALEQLERNAEPRVLFNIGVREPVLERGAARHSCCGAHATETWFLIGHGS